MAQQGFLLIADITGYTMFLTRSELEHPQGILDALFKSIFAEIKAPLLLSNLQGEGLVTEQAAEAIGLPEFFAGATRHVENAGDFGDIVCYVYDLAPIYARWRASRRVVVRSDEPLATRPRRHDHDRTFPWADRAGSDAALRPWQGVDDTRQS